MKKTILYILGVVIIGFTVLSIFYYPRLNIVSGFSSKSVASAVFLAKRTKESVENGDNNFSLIKLATNEIDNKKNVVISSFLGLKKRKSIFKEGVGSILVNDESFDESQIKVPNRSKSNINLPFPYGNLPQKDTIFSNINYENLSMAISNAFDKGEESVKKTRSVIVVYKDQIIAERYAQGFDKNTPILGWSMTKSITATIYGILLKQGKINLNSETGINDWQNDSRKNITYSDLLHMNSGLEWTEDYTTISDVTKMLYLEKNMGKVQLEKPAIGKSNETWNYSSGTTNLLAGPLLRKEFKTHQQYVDFWYNALLDRIGMNSALIEVDMSGNFVGSSYGWANTRDWAKFGLLYLNQGNWNGDQMIDSSFVKYVATPTNGSDGRYGAQFWLNAGGHYPDVTKDLFSANGFQGQIVAIIPSKDLVIVRTGLTEDPEFDFNNFFKQIIESIN